MPKSLNIYKQLLAELLQEDKIDIKEVLEVLGYEIVECEETDVYRDLRNFPIGTEEILIGYDEVITIRKQHR